MNGLTITNVSVRPCEHPGENLKAFASITLNSCFVVCDLKVIQGPNRLFVAMPSRRRRDGVFRDVAHPLNQAFREEIETRVLAAYEALPGGAPTAEEEPAALEDASPLEVQGA